MFDIPAERYFRAIDATWAPARLETCGPFRLRISNGGGKRVSAATLVDETATQHEIDAASSAMKIHGQTPLFMLKPGQERLDSILENMGFSVSDPTVVYASPVEELARHAPKGLEAIPVETPLAAQKEIWATDNIGPDRIDVMTRTKTPKSYVLGRESDRIAGTVFVGCDGEIAMLHALTVSKRARRKGVGKNLTYSCAGWAMTQGATIFGLLTTVQNKPARALYEGLGMRQASRYHYRIKSE